MNVSQTWSMTMSSPKWKAVNLAKTTMLFASSLGMNRFFTLVCAGILLIVLAKQQQWVDDIAPFSLTCEKALCSYVQCASYAALFICVLYFLLRSACWFVEKQTAKAGSRPVWPKPCLQFLFLFLNPNIFFFLKRVLHSSLACGHMPYTPVFKIFLAHVICLCNFIFFPFSFNRVLAATTPTYTTYTLIVTFSPYSLLLIAKERKAKTKNTAAK